MLFTAPSHPPDTCTAHPQRPASAVTSGGARDKEEREMVFNDVMSGWGGGWISWTMYLGMMVSWASEIDSAEFGLQRRELF